MLVANGDVPTVDDIWSAGIGRTVVVHIVHLNLHVLWVIPQTVHLRFFLGQLAQNSLLPRTVWGLDHLELLGQEQLITADQVQGIFPFRCLDFQTRENGSVQVRLSGFGQWALFVEVVIGVFRMHFNSIKVPVKGNDLGSPVAASGGARSSHTIFNVTEVDELIAQRFLGNDHPHLAIGRVLVSIEQPCHEMTTGCHLLKGLVIFRNLFISIGF